MPGARSSTSKTRSNETSALITSTRTLDSAVSGPYSRVSSSASVTTVPAVMLPVDREPAAEAVRQGLRERRDQQHRDEERAAEHGLLDADVADPGGPRGEPRRLVVGPAEQLDQQRAGDAEPLGHGRVHRGVELVGLAGDRGQPLADPPGRQHEQRQQAAATAR